MTKNRIPIMIILSVIMVATLVTRNTVSCCAMDKSENSSYNLSGVSVQIELSVNGKEYCFSGTSSDYCDYEVVIDYICADGSANRVYRSDQRMLVDFQGIATSDIVTIRAEYTVTANNDESITDSMAVY